MPLDRFAELLSEHDAEAGDPGGNVRAVAKTMGISYGYARVMLQRLCAIFGDQAG